MSSALTKSTLFLVVFTDKTITAINKMQHNRQSLVCSVSLFEVLKVPQSKRKFQQSWNGKKERWRKKVKQKWWRQHTTSSTNKINYNIRLQSWTTLMLAQCLYHKFENRNKPNKWNKILARWQQQQQKKNDEEGEEEGTARVQTNIHISNPRKFWNAH